MESSRATGQKRKVKIIFISAQWARRPIKGRGLRECFFEAPFRHHQCHLHDLGRTSSHPSRVMFVARLLVQGSKLEPKRSRVENQPAMSFSKEDEVETIQPHDNALVVTLRIEGYDVKRVMVDQGNGKEIMYPDLYNRLGLKPEDLIAYDSPLVSFNEKVAIPKDQI